MLWKGRRRSANVEDRRGIGGRGLAVGGGIGAVIVAAIILLLGGNPDDVLQNVPVTGIESPLSSGTLSAEDREMGDFVSVVLADTEDVWNALFRQAGKTYREPSLVLFTDQTASTCGYASGASGPFYCPADEKVYIDLGFFRQLQSQLGASGDFAMAYVIAHEVGHHVQNLLGIIDQVNSMKPQLGEREANRLSICMELQADFLAGVWAHHAQRLKGILEEGDVEEAVNAAAAVGDDRIQRMTRGAVVPDSFTHGTSEQRMNWFLKGYRSGDVGQGDTFNAEVL
ncbi:MAG: neutral zinc metallopeptidase [Candidatus Aminicenantes bacterium]|nr:neutral zinc metallopeptidase [Candidatus Aminicenantes bacterium]